MTETREFYAATVDEAVLRAAAALNIAPDRLSYEVVDPGGAGFLGIGAKDARINVRIEEASPPDSVADDSQKLQEAEVPTLDPTIPKEDNVRSPYVEEVRAAEEPASPELLNEVKELVTSLVEAMGLSARIDVYESDDEIAVDVASPETGLFIGQKGETIDSLQYLVNVAAYKDRTFAKRIVLDSEGYRQRRIEAIQGIAHRTARKAIREGRPVELPPMSAPERRVVHVYLKDNPQVNTASEGAGHNRRVTISPT